MNPSKWVRGGKSATTEAAPIVGAGVDLALPGKLDEIAVLIGRVAGPDRRAEADELLRIVGMVRADPGGKIRECYGPASLYGPTIRRLLDGVLGKDVLEGDALLGALGRAFDAHRLRPVVAKPAAPSIDLDAFGASPDAADRPGPAQGALL